MKTHKNFLAASIGIALAGSAAGAQVPDSALAVSRQGQSLFRLNVDASAVFRGQVGAGAIPVEGSGARMMWYPAKAAFRAGYVSGTQWDDANIGNNSVAIGENVRANGPNGVAFGLRSTAANISSVAIGEDNTASGAASVALGYHAHTNARAGSFVFSDRASVDSTRPSPLPPGRGFSRPQCPPQQRPDQTPRLSHKRLQNGEDEFEEHRPQNGAYEFHPPHPFIRLMSSTAIEPRLRK